MANIDELMFQQSQEPPAAATLADIERVAETAVSYTLMAQKLEAELKAINAEINNLRTKVLPGMMGQAGLQSFKMKGGTTIEITDFCSGSLPKDPVKREEAIQWLIEHDGESLLKTNVEVVFGKGGHEEALALAEELKAECKTGTVSIESGVHPQTLQSYARERIKLGEPVDASTLGLYIGRHAKIKLGGAA